MLLGSPWTCSRPTARSVPAAGATRPVLARMRPTRTSATVASRRYLDGHRSWAQATPGPHAADRVLRDRPRPDLQMIEYRHDAAARIHLRDSRPLQNHVHQKLW